MLVVVVAVAVLVVAAVSFKYTLQVKNHKFNLSSTMTQKTKTAYILLRTVVGTKMAVRQTQQRCHGLRFLRALS